MRSESSFASVATKESIALDLQRLLAEVDRLRGIFETLVASEEEHCSNESSTPPNPGVVSDDEDDATSDEISEPVRIRNQVLENASTQSSVVTGVRPAPAARGGTTGGQELGNEQLREAVSSGNGEAGAGDAPQPRQDNVNVVVDDAVSALTDDFERFLVIPQVAQRQGFVEPGRMYHSSQIRNSSGGFVGIGPGFNWDKKTYTSKGTGKTYSLRTPPPGRCFNCGENHWRVHCPYAQGNQKL